MTIRRRRSMVALVGLLLAALREARAFDLVRPEERHHRRHSRGAHGKTAEFAGPRLSPPTGFPASTVPMGFVRGTLPVESQRLRRAWSEPTLIKIAFGDEQATRHRPPPASTPPRPADPPR